MATRCSWSRTFQWRHQGTIGRNVPDAQGFNSFGYPDRSDGINTLKRPGPINRDSSPIKGLAISEGLLLQFRCESPNLANRTDWNEGGINAGSRESGVVPGTPEMHTNRFPLKVILWVSSRASSGLTPGNRGPVVIPNGAKDRSCAAGGTLVLSVRGSRLGPCSVIPRLPARKLGRRTTLSPALRGA